MSEHIPVPLADEEDLALQAALQDMQDIATRHLLATGRPFGELTEPEQTMLLDRTQRYVEQEFSLSEGLWSGMPFRVYGAGGVLIADDASIRMFQPLSGNCSVTGWVDSASVMPVPSFRAIAEVPGGVEGEKLIEDLVLSAVVFLNGARYHNETDDGEQLVQYDLSAYDVIAPAIYKMHATVAPIITV